MTNRAYASFWTREYSEELMLDRFERWLETVPLSAERPGFANLIIRAVDASETPLLEHDFRSGEADAASVIALAREHRSADCAYETEAYWDLWQPNLETGAWQRAPQRLQLTCHGIEYDGGVALELGHFMAILGLEHFFTGHAGLLGMRGAAASAAEPGDDIETRLLAAHVRPGPSARISRENAPEYPAIAELDARRGTGFPVERMQLWSEGEENLEARLDEILAVH